MVTESFPTSTSDQLGFALLLLGVVAVVAVVVVTAARSRRVRRPGVLWTVAGAAVVVVLGTLLAAASSTTLDGVYCALGDLAVADLLDTGTSMTTEYPDPGFGAACQSLARRKVAGAMAVGVVALVAWGVVVLRATRTSRTPAGSAA